MPELTDITTTGWWWVICACMSGGATGILAMIAMLLLEAPWWAKLLPCIFGMSSTVAKAYRLKD